MNSFFGFAHMLSFILPMELSLDQSTVFPAFTLSNCLPHPVAGHEGMAVWGSVASRIKPQQNYYYSSLKYFLLLIVHLHHLPSFGLSAFVKGLIIG